MSRCQFEKLYGQRIGEVARMSWQHAGSVLRKEPCECSLIVNSEIAIILCVTAFEMCTQFPESVVQQLQEH